MSERVYKSHCEISDKPGDRTHSTGNARGDAAPEAEAKKQKRTETAARDTTCASAATCLFLAVVQKQQRAALIQTHPHHTQHMAKDREKCVRRVGEIAGSMQVSPTRA